jgi:hypothetical protein
VQEATTTPTTINQPKHNNNNNKQQPTLFGTGKGGSVDEGANERAGANVEKAIDDSPSCGAAGVRSSALSGSSSSFHAAADRPAALPELIAHLRTSYTWFLVLWRAYNRTRLYLCFVVGAFLCKQ